MARKAREVILSEKERANLEKRVRKGTEEQRMIPRLKIVLLASRGLETREIAERLGISQKTVCKWRGRYVQKGLDGLRDNQRSGKPWKFSAEERLSVITTACKPPKTTTHWSVRDLQKEVSKKISRSISYVTIYRILKSIDLKPHQYEMWLNSQDPEFEAKQAEIVGLYMNPPENALVLSVDEKTGMQALGRKYPNKPMIPGYPEKVESHYVRYGTKSLIAALAVHKGEVIGKCYDHHRHEEFIDFLGEIERTYPDKELHLIVDNLSVHKHKDVKKWLAKRKGKIKFHFTPTHASWLNQIELWFSILSRKVLKRGIFSSREDLVETVMKFIKEYSQEAKPFKWTYTGDPLKI